MAIQPAFPPDRFLPPDDPVLPGDWANPPTAWAGSSLIDSPEAVEVVRAALTDMPAEVRRVMVLRDVEGRSPSEVRRALDLSAAARAWLLQHARGLVRARLESFERTEAAS